MMKNTLDEGKELQSMSEDVGDITEAERERKVAIQSLFNRRAGIVIFILIGLIGYVIYKFIKGYSPIEYYIILATAIISIIGIYILIKAKEHHFLMNENKMGGVKIFLLDFVLLGALGFLTLDLFFVKGVYGLYCLFSPFTWDNFWGNLLFRLLIILLSYKLVQGVDTIQGVFKLINKTPKRR